MAAVLRTELLFLLERKRHARTMQDDEIHRCRFRDETTGKNSMQNIRTQRPEFNQGEIWDTFLT